MYKFSLIDKISVILVIIGSINWGLIGLFNFNLVSSIFSFLGTVFIRIIYILVGVAGINIILLLTKMKKNSK